MLRSLVAMLFAVFTQLAFAQSAGPAAPAGSPAAAERTLAGKIALVEGDVQVFDDKQQARRPGPGDPVYEGDSIFTGTDGELHLDMEDGGYIGVRPATKMSIAGFKAEGGADDRSLITLLEGSFRAVTGWIAGLNRKNVQIRTPTATIGVRGTDYEPLVIPEGSSLGEPGTYNRVYTGETEIRTDQGTVSVKPNQAGFVPHRGAPRPRLLERVPAFFRAGRNEKRFEGLHERLHRQLEERRLKRVKEIGLRRAQRLDRGAQAKQAQKQREERKRDLRTREKERLEQRKQAHKPGEERRREPQQRRREALEQRKQAQPERRQQAQKQAEERRRELQGRQKERDAAKAERGKRGKRQIEKRE